MQQTRESQAQRAQLKAEARDNNANASAYRVHVFFEFDSLAADVLEHLVQLHEPLHKLQSRKRKRVGEHGQV